MPRYFLHLLDGIDAVDDEGADHPDLSAARHAAIAGARDLMREQLREGYLDLDGCIQITSATGEEVLRVSFFDAFEIRGSVALKRAWILFAKHRDCSA